MTRKISIIQVLFWLTAIIVTVIFLFNRKGCNTLTTELNADTITVTDTLILKDTVFIKKEVKVKQAAKIVFVDVPAETDTAEILKKYYAKVFRDDTLMNDSSLFFRLKQIISKNDVIKQEIEVHRFDKTKVITKETTIKVPVPAPKIYAGAFTILSQNKAVIGGKITYRTKKNYLISAGYGTNKTVLIDAVFPLNLIFTKKMKK
ncbi:MAG: hypothetical protein L3J56_06360 [Bacteroidales bacterium]|nr:hypothetical protein [Bacteroidales bacterium]